MPLLGSGRANSLLLLGLSRFCREVAATIPHACLRLSKVSLLIANLGCV